MGILDTVRKNVRNIPGWRTSKKIVVFESDDWGSERTKDGATAEALRKAGYAIQKCHMTSIDTLESNTDLELLYAVLSTYKDKNGNHPSITGFFNVANPDFDKIRASGYKEYHHLNLEETARKYKDHDRIIDLYKEGIQKGVFHAEYHGREHYHAMRWLRDLQAGQEDVLKGFDLDFNGFSRSYAPAIKKGFRPTYDLDTIADLDFMKKSLTEGIDLFKKIFDYDTTYFVPPNGIYPRLGDFEKVMYDAGIRFIGGPSMQMIPDGAGKTVKKHFTLGQRNLAGQTFITRNGIFEPYSEKRNWVEYCLEDIQLAYRWNKPAVISTHRANFVGTISEKNRDNSLKQLDMLISQILSKWPETEFMTSKQFSNLMTGTK